MKNKIFGLLVLSVLAFAVLASFASALSASALTFKNLNDVESLTITGTVGETISLPTAVTASNSRDVATLSYFSDANATTPITSGTVTLTATTLTVYVKATPNSYFMLGGSSVVPNGAVLRDVSPGTNTAPFLVSFNSPHLSLSIDSTHVTSGYGDDTSWYPLDSIEARVDVTNNGNDKINSIVVSYGLYDTQHGKWIVKGSESSFSLNDGNDKEVSIDFNLSDSNLDSGNQNNYQFYVWATGKDTSLANNDKVSSVSSLSGVSVNFDDDFVILNNLQFTQTSTPCGGQAEITGNVENIGSNDEDNVAIKVYNAALGLNQKINVGSLNSLESAPLDFTLNVPSDANAGTYQLLFTVIDSTGNVFENSNNDLSQFNLPLTVSGSCTFNPKMTVSASVQAGGNAGQELDVIATVTNTDSLNSRSLLVTATNYQSWANLISVSPSTLTLSPGQSKEVTIKMTPNSGVSGQQTFNLQFTDNGNVIPQPITVTIQNPSGIGSLFTGSTIGGNGYLWLIGGLNILLVFVIIVVAVRIARRK